MKTPECSFKHHLILTFLHVIKTFKRTICPLQSLWFLAFLTTLGKKKKRNIFGKMLSHGNVCIILLDKPMRLYESLKMFYSLRSRPASWDFRSAGQGLEGAAVLSASSTCLLLQPGPSRGSLREAPGWGWCHREDTEASAFPEACEAHQLLEAAQLPQVAFFFGIVFLLS